MPTRKFFYKRAEFVRWPHDLESTLAMLVGSLPSKRDRCFSDSELFPLTIDDGGKTGVDASEVLPQGQGPQNILCWMKYIRWETKEKQLSERYLCGHAVRYTPGVGAAAFNLEEPGEEVALSSLLKKMPPNVNVAESQACFLVKGNDVIVMPGGSLTGAHLAAYLQHLLLKAGKFAADNQLRFRDFHSARGRGRLVGVQNLRLGVRASKATSLAEAITQATGPAFEFKNVLTGLGRMYDSMTGQLSAHHARQFERMNFDVKIGFDRGIRTKNDSVLDDLMSLIPEEMFHYLKVALPQTGEVSGDKLQLFRSALVNYVDDVPVPESFAPKMAEFLVNLRQTGRLSDGKAISSP